MSAAEANPGDTRVEGVVPDEVDVESDPTFDRVARLISQGLGAPISLVSVIRAERQYMPGAFGLREPWMSARSVPLTHSLCQYVVVDDAPLVIDDVREDARSAQSLAITDLGVASYAGMPLRDDSGAPVGSVCAIDFTPRTWSTSDLTLLADFAELCTAELALRRARAELSESLGRQVVLADRLQLLLTLSEALAEATSTIDVAQAVRDVAQLHLHTLHAGVWLTEGRDAQQLRYVQPRSDPWPLAERNVVLDVSRETPLGESVVTGDNLFFADHADQDDRFPAFARYTAGSDAEARAMLPLRVGGRSLGTLVLAWEATREFTENERVAMTALTSYTAQALSRALLLAERATAARTLQTAMLTTGLPHVPGATLAARYLPAADNNEVGGDWYDALVNRSGVVELATGDVAGHDVSAAAVMGALRNMLRVLAWRDGATPAEVVTTLDAACFDLQVDRYATLVFGSLEHAADSADGLVFVFSNAGHLPPIVARDGTANLVESSSPGVPLRVIRDAPRHDSRVALPPGSTLLLYTDGLVERRDESLSRGLTRLRETVVRHSSLDIEPMLDAVIADMLSTSRDDDVAVLAVRVA